MTVNCMDAIKEVLLHGKDKDVRTENGHAAWSYLE